MASRVFADPDALLEEDRIVDGEERLHVIGMVEEIGIVLVTYTVTEDETEEHIHIISARYAERWERQKYLEGLGYQ